jgi:hypothetical protein
LEGSGASKHATSGTSISLRRKLPAVQSEKVASNDNKNIGGKQIAKSLETGAKRQNRGQYQTPTNLITLEAKGADLGKGFDSRISEKVNSDEEDSRSILSMPASVTGRPMRNSSVSLQKPGEGSNPTLTDDGGSSRDAMEEEIEKTPAFLHIRRPSTPTANASIQSIPPTSPSAASTTRTTKFPVLNLNKKGPSASVEHMTTSREHKRSHLQDTKLLVRNSSNESSEDDDTEPDEEEEIREPVQNLFTPTNSNYRRGQTGQTAPVYRQKEATDSTLNPIAFPDLNPKV